MDDQRVHTVYKGTPCVLGNACFVVRVGAVYGLVCGVDVGLDTARVVYGYGAVGHGFCGVVFDARMVCCVRIDQ